MPLDSPFLQLKNKPHEAYSKELGAALLDHIWGIAEPLEDHDVQRYFEHYRAIVLNKAPEHLSFQTHRDVVTLIGLIRSGSELPHEELRKSISAYNATWLMTPPSEEELQTAVRIGVAIWLMIDTRHWTDESTSLSQFVQSRFDTSSSAPGVLDAELDFTARALDTIGGVEFEYTSQINDHLRLDRKSGRVCLFRYASFLGRRRDDGQDTVYPQGLLRETAETLAILFPHSQITRHRLWKRRIRKKAEVDVEDGVAAYTPRNLDHYVIWRYRLAQLQEYYDRTAPTHVRQWVYDRRDGNRFFTFWLAVIAIGLALIFGAIQCVTGILQVIKS